MIKRKIPIWKRSCLGEFNLDTIRSRVDDIAEIEWEYESSSRGEDFQIFFSDISARAMRLSEMLYTYRFDLQETDDCKGWDDFTVALLGGLYRVLGFDAYEMNYSSLFQRGWGYHGEQLAIEEAQKRIERLTKSELISRWQKVLTVVVSYLELIAAYDGLTAALDFLENDGMKKAEELTRGIEREYSNLWESDGRTIDYSRLACFEAELNKTYPEMWVW